MKNFSILALGENETLKALAKKLPNKVFLYNPLMITPTRFKTAPLENIQKVIVISANAVQYGLKKIATKLPDSTEYFAIGENTAKLTGALTHQAVHFPEVFNAENLLMLPNLQHVDKQNILIIKGVGGRTIIEETLSARGAIVYTMDCYERHAKDIDLTHEMQTWQNHDVKFLLVTSEESLNAFELQVDKEWLYSLTLIVTSERLEHIALEKGLTQILRASHFAVEDVLKLV